ncbi:MAG: hypothetical protein JJ920_20330 [Roseitalea sp.]|nr:hypothetical protein [Roseitalea sp.]MBO6723191.1 hypothetical protein [Roseitalea sp.]MBO6745262.1 hypothetical protein [Roseitalea sp.]
MPDPLENQDDARAYVRAVAPVVGLKLHGDDLDRVAQQVQRAARFTHRIAQAHETLDLQEPANVFGPAESDKADANP